MSLELAKAIKHEKMFNSLNLKLEKAFDNSMNKKS